MSVQCQLCGDTHLLMVPDVLHMSEYECKKYLAEKNIVLIEPKKSVHCPECHPGGLVLSEKHNVRSRNLTQYVLAVLDKSRAHLDLLNTYLYCHIASDKGYDHADAIWSCGKYGLREACLDHEFIDRYRVIDPKEKQKAMSAVRRVARQFDMDDVPF
jgi:hypothetical protein